MASRRHVATGQHLFERERLVLTDTLGNVLASRVVPAHMHDGPVAITFRDEVAATHDLLG